MSKLPKEYKFLDLSDYGRPVAQVIARMLQYTPVTAVHVTLLFVCSGVMAIYCMIHNHMVLVGFFLILKSILDAADGELARLKKQPSYVGRYLDSVSDILLNFAFLYTIYLTTNASLWWFIIAFVGIQLQGTLYNYYYVILRNRFNGDTTSRVFENEVPEALPGEKQVWVSILFRVYQILYTVFDKSIFLLDSKAVKSSFFPTWFMTMISIFGLGFQLLVIAVLGAFGWSDIILPVICWMTIGIPLFIVIRMIGAKLNK